MEENLAYCGLICQTCQIYLATREPDKEKQYKMRVDIAQEIKKYYGMETKPEDVHDCDGCNFLEPSRRPGVYAGGFDCRGTDDTPASHLAHTDSLVGERRT